MTRYAGTGRNGSDPFAKHQVLACRFTGSIHVFEKSIQLPRLGTLRLKEQGYLPVGTKVAQATVSEQAGRWYISIQVETPNEAPQPACGSVIGVDLGLKTLAVISDGREIANPKAMRTRLQKVQRNITRLRGQRSTSAPAGRLRRT